MKPSKFQDKLLLVRLKKNDAEAFAKVYDTYVTPIYRFIYFKVPTRHDAEDLTADVFLKLWQFICRADSDEPIDNLRALLYRIARNRVVDFYRENAKKENDQFIDEVPHIPDERQQRLLSQLDIEFKMSDLNKVLRQLKDEYREVIVLKYIDEYSTGEIAKILDKSKGSVRVLLHRALKVTKELLPGADNENDK